MPQVAPITASQPPSSMRHPGDRRCSLCGKERRENRCGSLALYLPAFCSGDCDKPKLSFQHVLNDECPAWLGILRVFFMETMIFKQDHDDAHSSRIVRVHSERFLNWLLFLLV